MISGHFIEREKNHLALRARMILLPIGRGVDPGGGGVPPPPMKILGGQTYRFAPPPNNFANLKNS